MRDDAAVGRAERRRHRRVPSTGTSRSASAASSTLMRLAARRNAGGVGARVAQLHQRVVHERMVNEVKRHGAYIT